METKVTSLMAAAAAIFFSLTSCLAPVPAHHDMAMLRVSVIQDPDTRAGGMEEDVSLYTFSLVDSHGKCIYKGFWGDCPAEFELDPGNYTVSLMSDESVEPAYERPLFGDSRGVSLGEGCVSEVALVLHQLNSGLRLLLSEAFVATYKEGALFLRSSTGTLAFGFSETRTAFFLPGRVSILLNLNGKSTVVHARDLNAGEILNLRLGIVEKTPSVSLVSGVDLNVIVDTTRVWTDETFNWDGSGLGSGDNSGSTPESVSVSVARGMAGNKKVWVNGYIVGGDLTSTKCSFEGPFSSRSNLVLADSPGCRDRDKCMSVQLSAGDIRNALNLVDNPSMLGRKVYLCGDVVEAYYRLPGLQSLSDYRL